ADPRQLNPAIPDEVAALLARMMAKDPRQRYQRPEELVGPLIALAQRLGGANRGVDSGPFVDAPLPGRPPTRPRHVGAVHGGGRVASAGARGLGWSLAFALASGLERPEP